MLARASGLGSIGSSATKVLEPFGHLKAYPGYRLRV